MSTPPFPLDTAARSNGAATPSGAAAADPRRRRVILVGRTGIDGALAPDPLTDVVETVDALGAIGELSRAGTGGPSTVVVGPDADPGAEAGRFVAGLRQLDPAVRVVVVGDQTRGVYDEALAAGSSVFTPAPVAPTAGSAVPARGAALPRTPVVVEVPAEAALPEGVPAPIAPTVSGPTGEGVSVQITTGAPTEETSLVDALLHGRDLLLPALELVRVRVASKDVYFLPAQPGPEGPGEADVETTWAGSVSVAHAGVEHGRLVSGSIDSVKLAECARWLATWLALRSQHDHLRQAAFTDELTGAYNRRYFARFLTGALEQARQRRVPLTVLVFDIDNFKTYNDRFGHGAGDEILIETSRLMRSVIRPADKVCRIGGDEFAVIFYDPRGPRSGRTGDGQGSGEAPTAPGPGAGGALASIYDIARRFQREICEHRFPKLGTEAPGTLTISGGMATYPWDGNTADELLQRADELAMQSKRAGKNVITYGPGAERVCRM
jgi:two-component system cell cycle response regulator